MNDKREKTANSGGDESGPHPVNDRLDLSGEDNYWRTHFKREPYYDRDYSFDDYGPAFRVGYDGRVRSDSRSFDEAEPGLRQRWEETKGSSRLAWEKARDAARAAWDRVSSAGR